MSGGHIFVSYAHADAAYVKRVVGFLARSGVDVWMDDEIPTGERWDQVLRQQIESCVGFVLVMSPAAAGSYWVGQEVSYARSLGKPVLPLLRGGQVIFGLDLLQHEDVSDGRLPSDQFVQRLRDALDHPGQPPARVPRRLVAHLIGVVPNAADCFQHRDIAGQLDAALAGGDTAIVTGIRDSSRAQILSGLGGVGKTQLAADLARQMRDDAGVHALVWISASSREAVLTSYAQAGAEITGADPSCSTTWPSPATWTSGGRPSCLTAGWW